MEHTDTDNLSVTEGSAQSKCAEATTKACCGERGTTQYWETICRVLRVSVLF